MQKFLFPLLAIFRGLNDAALRTSAYFNGNFSKCDNNAVKKFPASFLKARTSVSFGLRLDSSTLMLAAKSISISVADFLVFI